MSTRRIHTLLATACLLVVAAAGAQMPPAPQGTPDAMAQPPRPLDGPQSGATITGKVRQLLVNPNGEVDGLLLDNGTQVGVAPHLSSALTQAVKPNDTVEITGSQAPGATMMRATSVRNTATGRGVADQPDAGRTPPAPRQPGALIAMSASGRITRLLHGPMGETNGVLLDGGSAVRFPPRAAEGLDLRVGAPLYAVGYGTRNELGSSLEATRLGATLETTRETFGPAPGRPDAAGPDGPPMRPKPPMDRRAAGQTPPPGDMSRPARGRMPPPAGQTPPPPPVVPSNGTAGALPGQGMSPPMPPAASSPR